jgi:hypothetical protein
VSLPGSTHWPNPSRKTSSTSASRSPTPLVALTGPACQALAPHPVKGPGNARRR